MSRVAHTTRIRQRDLGKLIDSQLGVITREQALGVGVTPSALRHRLRVEGPWTVVLPGVYLASNGAISGPQRLVAAVLYGGKASMVTGVAALEHHGIWHPGDPMVDVLIPSSRSRHDAGYVRMHRSARLPEAEPSGPMRYAPAPRAVGDAARSLMNLRDVRAVVASSVQRGRCTVEELAAELLNGPRAGSAYFREAVSDVIAGIRSVAEADLKKLIDRSGLEQPLYNPELWAGDTLIAIPDAWWPRYGVAVEVDSREWHLSPQDHARTLERGRRMTRHQILAHHFTPNQLRRSGHDVIAQIQETIEDARDRPPLNIRTIPVDHPDYGQFRHR